MANPDDIPAGFSLISEAGTPVAVATAPTGDVPAGFSSALPAQPPPVPMTPKMAAESKRQFNANIPAQSPQEALFNQPFDVSSGSGALDAVTRIPKLMMMNAEDAATNPFKPAVDVSGVAQGALRTVTAGASDALAHRGFGVNLNDPNASKNVSPYSDTIGEDLGLGIPLGPIATAGKGILNAAKTGAKLGAVYGGVGGGSEALKNDATLPEAATQAAEGAALGTVAGAGLGAGAARLTQPVKNVLDQSKQAEKLFFEVLGPGATKEQVSSLKGNLNLALPTLKGDQKDLQQFTDSVINARKAQWNGIDKVLSGGEGKGLVIPGNDLGIEVMKSAFPPQFLDRMSSTERQGLNDAVTTLNGFRGKSYNAQGLNNLATGLLADNGRYSDIPRDGRVAMVKYLNSLSADPNVRVSGDDLFVKGLKTLYPVDLSNSDQQLLSIADNASKYMNKDITPYQAEDRIQKLNKELSQYYAAIGPGADVKEVNPEIVSRESEVRALRSSLDSTLSKLGNEFQDSKKTLGALMSLQDLADSATNREKIKNTSTTLMQKVMKTSVTDPLAGVRKQINETQGSPSAKIARAVQLQKSSQAAPPIVAPPLTKAVKTSPLTRGLSQKSSALLGIGNPDNQSSE